MDHKILQASDCSETESPFAEIAQVEQFMLWSDDTYTGYENTEDDIKFYQNVLTRTTKAIHAVKMDIAKQMNMLEYVPYSMFLIVNSFTEEAYDEKMTYYIDHYDYLRTWNIRSLSNIHYINQTEKMRDAIDYRDFCLSSYKKRIDVFELSKQEIHELMPLMNETKYNTNNKKMIGKTLAKIITAFLPLDEFFQDCKDVRDHYNTVKDVNNYVAENEIYTNGDNYNMEKTMDITNWIKTTEEIFDSE